MTPKLTPGCLVELKGPYKGVYFFECYYFSSASYAFQNSFRSLYLSEVSVKYSDTIQNIIDPKDISKLEKIIYGIFE